MSVNFGSSMVKSANSMALPESIKVWTHRCVITTEGLIHYIFVFNF
jgi:hypothetical protein